MTKEKFQAFVKVQRSGKTNMFDVNRVCKLSKGVLTPKDCHDIMRGENYALYESKFITKVN